MIIPRVADIEMEKCTCFGFMVTLEHNPATLGNNEPEGGMKQSLEIARLEFEPRF